MKILSLNEAISEKEAERERIIRFQDKLTKILVSVTNSFVQCTYIFLLNMTRSIRVLLSFRRMGIVHNCFFFFFVIFLFLFFLFSVLEQQCRM